MLTTSSVLHLCTYFSFSSVSFFVYAFTQFVDCVSVCLVRSFGDTIIGRATIQHLYSPAIFSVRVNQCNKEEHLY